MSKIDLSAVPVLHAEQFVTAHLDDGEEIICMLDWSDVAALKRGQNPWWRYHRVVRVTPTKIVKYNGNDWYFHPGQRIRFHLLNGAVHELVLTEQDADEMNEGENPIYPWVWTRHELVHPNDDR